MKKFILPIFIFSILFSSYALGTIAHFIKLKDGEKTLVFKTTNLSYDDALKMNESGDFKRKIEPEANNTYVQEIEITRKKGILGWKSNEKVVKRYIKSTEE